MRIDEEVITKVEREGYPAGTWGVVSDIDEEGIWVDLYIPAYDDIPTDTVCYSEDELEIT